MIYNRTFGLSLVALIFGILSSAAPLRAQETPQDFLKIAKKQEKLARAATPAEKIEIYEKALAVYKELTERWPTAKKEVAQAYFNAAKLSLRLKRNEEALASFQEVLKQEGQTTMHSKTLMAMSSYHRKAKQLDEAQKDLQRILDDCADSRKDCAKARILLGNMAKKAKKMKTAIRWANSVLDEHPDAWRENVDAAQLIVGVYAQCRRWQEAKGMLLELDQKLRERFRETKFAGPLERALGKMSSRRMLTPVAIEDEVEQSKQ